MRYIFCLLFFLTLSVMAIAQGNDGSIAESNINWITVWLSFLYGVLFTMLFGYLNKNTKKVDQRSNAGLPLQGWIVILGITLVIRLGFQLYFFWNEHYYAKTVWTALQQHGGAKLHTLFIFEMFLKLFGIAGTGALLYWFLGRRDIFPTLFIYYISIVLISQLILLLLYRHMSLPPDMILIRQNTHIQFIRMIFYSAVWVAYLLKSERVKQTFMYPPG